MPILGLRNLNAVFATPEEWMSVALGLIFWDWLSPEAEERVQDRRTVLR